MEEDKATEYIIPRSYLKSFVCLDLNTLRSENFNLNLNQLNSLDKVVKGSFPCIRDGDIVALLPRYLRDKACPNNYLFIWSQPPDPKSTDLQSNVLKSNDLQSNVSKSNDSKHILSGCRKLSYDNRLDKNGCIPLTFRVSKTTFSPTHWKRIIHNYKLFWPDDDLIELAKDNIRRSALGADVDTILFWYSKFSIHNKIYLLFYNGTKCSFETFQDAIVLQPWRLGSSIGPDDYLDQLNKYNLPYKILFVNSIC